MTISEYNREIDRWRTEAKKAHGYTDKELAKRLMCSVSTLTHTGQFYRLPYYKVMRLKELANSN